MNKKMILIGVFCFSANIFANIFANSFVSIITPDESLKFVDSVERIEEIKSEWIPISNIQCSVNIEDSEIYFGQLFDKEEKCIEKQEQTITTQKILTDGTIVIIDIKKEQRDFEVSSSRTESTGTLTLNSCNEILKNNHSNGSGIYKISPSNIMVDAYCDMTTDEGGWTQIVANKSPIGTESGDYMGIINGLWDDGVGKFIKLETIEYSSLAKTTIYYERLTPYTRNFYLDILETFRNNEQVLDVDFIMNHNYSNLKTRTNNFSFCNFSNDIVPEHTYVGFPRDCGQTTNIGGRWIGMYGAYSGDTTRRFATSFGHPYTLWIK